jgi:hypothetical protein
VGHPAQDVKHVNVTPPGAINDNATFATAEVDTIGFDYLKYVVILGATDIAVATMKLTESDVTASGHADITGGNMLTDGTAPSATSDNGIFTFYVNLKGRKRFIDLTFVGGDGAAGTYACVLAELSQGQTTPSTAALRGNAGELFV